MSRTGNEGLRRRGVTGADKNADKVISEGQGKVKSGTEKHPNPHEVALGRHLRAMERPARGFVALANGQLVWPDTLERWNRELELGREREREQAQR